MKNFKVTVLTDKTNDRSKMVVNILANSASEARQKALAMYGVKGRVVAVV
ncbi:hypothetical protein [Cupriavidus nantongensis]